MDVSSHTLQWHTLAAANWTPALLAALGANRLSASQLEAQAELVAAFERAYSGARVDLCAKGHMPADFVLSKFYEGQPWPLDPQWQARVERLRPLFQALIQVDLAREQLTGAPAGARVIALIAIVAPVEPSPFDWAALSRPKPGLTHNGDGFLVTQRGQALLACLIDGLGHGPEAQQARDRGLEVLAHAPELELAELFALAHSALRRTRGAAMTAARIDDRQGILAHAGIGNVELRMTPDVSVFLALPGIVGMAPWPGVRVRECSWSEGALLVLHSDGIRPGWSLAALDRLQLPPLFLALLLAVDCAADEDDATVLVVKGSRHG